MGACPIFCALVAYSSDCGTRQRPRHVSLSRQTRWLGTADMAPAGDMALAGAHRIPCGGWGSAWPSALKPSHLHAQAFTSHCSSPHVLMIGRCVPEVHGAAAAPRSQSVAAAAPGRVRRLIALRLDRRPAPRGRTSYCQRTQAGTGLARRASAADACTLAAVVLREAPSSSIHCGHKGWGRASTPGPHAQTR